MIQNNKLMNESRMRQSLLSEEQRGDIKDWRTDLFDAFNKNYFVVTPLMQKLPNELMFISNDQMSAFDIKSYEYDDKKDDVQIFENGQLILSIQTIQAFEKNKNHGKRITSQLIEFSNKTNLPLTTWIETEEMIKYLKAFNFENLEKNEANDKWAAIYRPTPVK